MEDAEDLVQETMLRAWRRLDTFEGRAPFRAWLYKIASHACFDALEKRPRRSLPTTSRPASDPREPAAPPLADPVWLDPLPDEWLAPGSASPEARYAARESVTLAFLAALQALPPRQRAVLILRDALDWPASEVAECLDMTVSAANSALHRARATLGKHYHGRGQEGLAVSMADERTRVLLDRYVRAWEAADVAGLVALLKEDAAFTMPPSPSWFRGRDAVAAFAAATVFAGAALGRWRLRPARANTQPAFALYQRDDPGGKYRAFGIQVLTVEAARLVEVTTFVNAALFSRFGLPDPLIE